MEFTYYPVVFVKKKTNGIFDTTETIAVLVKDKNKNGWKTPDTAAKVANNYGNKYTAKTNKLTDYYLITNNGIKNVMTEDNVEIFKW